MPSVVGLGIGLLLMVWPLLSRQHFAAYLKRLQLIDILLAAATLAVPMLVVWTIRDPSVPSPSSLEHIARILLFPAEGKFLMPLVGAFVYWGPLVLVAMLVWCEASTCARGLGLGALLTIALTLPFGLVGEARFLTAAWPFMVLVLAMTLDRMPLGRRFALPFAILTVAFAQFWLPLNIAPWDDRLFDNLDVFPKQMYFLHFGPWMNWTTFLVQATIMVCGAGWLASALWRRSATTAFTD